MCNNKSFVKTKDLEDQKSKDTESKKTCVLTYRRNLVRPRAG